MSWFALVIVLVLCANLVWLSLTVYKQAIKINRLKNLIKNTASSFLSNDKPSTGSRHRTGAI